MRVMAFCLAIVLALSSGCGKRRFRPNYPYPNYPSLNFTVTISFSNGFHYSTNPDKCPPNSPLHALCVIPNDRVQWIAGTGLLFVSFDMKSGNPAHQLFANGETSTFATTNVSAIKDIDAHVDPGERFRYHVVVVDPAHAAHYEDPVIIIGRKP